MSSRDCQAAALGTMAQEDSTVLARAHESDKTVSLLRVALEGGVSTTVALRLCWRLWCHAVAMCQRQDLLEEMREVYAETLIDWRDQTSSERQSVKDREAALQSRDAALAQADRERRLREDLRAERDAAVRDRNFYRERVAQLERELASQRQLYLLNEEEPGKQQHLKVGNGFRSSHQRHCSSKWIAHLKARCAAVTDRLDDPSSL